MSGHLIARPRLACTPLEDRTTPAVLQLVVDTPNDVVDPADARTSLREAIRDAEASVSNFDSAEISFAPALAGANIFVTEIGGFQLAGASAFQIVSGQNVVIVGSGQRIVRAGRILPELGFTIDTFRLFGIGSVGHLELRDLEIANGRATRGGGIYNDGVLIITNSTITDNIATGVVTSGPSPGRGGGIYTSFFVTVTITNSTITGNQALPTSTAPGEGGGIYSDNSNTSLTHVTVADNVGSGQVYNNDFSGGAFIISDSILSESGNPTGPALISSRGPVSGARNLITGVVRPPNSSLIVSTSDPLLGPLQNNGGFTRTRALPFGSPAVDAGLPRGFSGGALIDQRGVDRPFGVASDLGAYEGVFLATLSGSVYADADDDGVFDPGETPIPGVLISLTNGRFTQTTTTGADGSYTFTGLVPGTYTVTETQPAGFLDGMDTAGSLGGTAANDAILDIEVPSNGSGVNYNFGEQTIPLPPPPPPPPTPVMVVGAGLGGGPHVKVFTVAGTELASFYAYDPQFTGGVRVSQGDFNDDGIADIVTATGPGGGPHVKVFDGATGAIIRSFFAFDPQFAGGVYVASADVNDDGVADIVVGAGEGGGPHVKVFDGATGAVILSFFAYSMAVDCGVTVGCDGGRIVTGTGFGHPAHVKVFDAATGTELSSFFAFSGSFIGVNVAASVDSHGLTVVTGQSNGQAITRRVIDTLQDLTFNAFEGTTGGVTVAAGEYNGDDLSDFATGAGAGTAPRVRVFDGTTGVELFSFLAFDAGFSGGVFVG